MKILDFGIARIASTTVSKSTTKIMGTPYYMSPEQWSGGAVDHRADIFSLGVMLYEMLTGRRPFESHNSQAVAFQVINSEPTPIHELNTTVPNELVEIVSKSLAKKPDERFRDVQEIQDELHEITDALSDLDLDLDLDFEETESLDATPQVRPQVRTTRSGRTPRSRSGRVQPDPGKRWLWAGLAVTTAVAATAGWFLLTQGRPSAVDNATTSVPTTASVVDEAVSLDDPTPPPLPPPPPVATTTVQPSTSTAAAIRTSAAQPTTGTLVVRSTPGASIVVDGRSMGTAPTRLLLDPGTHRIRLSSSGVSWEDVVTIERGRATTLDRPLDRVGALAVNSGTWATIRLDGGEARETPHFFQNVPAGRHTLHVSREGYESQLIEMAIREGENFQLTLDMRRTP